MVIIKKRKKEKGRKRIFSHTSLPPLPNRSFLPLWNLDPYFLSTLGKPLKLSEETVWITISPNPTNLQGIWEGEPPLGVSPSGVLINRRAAETNCELISKLPRDKVSQGEWGGGGGGPCNSYTLCGATDAACLLLPPSRSPWCTRNPYII